MDLSSLPLNLDSLGSSQASGFLQTITSPSPEFLSKLSSLSLTQMLWMMGGLMLFRVFGGMLFAIVGLVGMVFSTVTSIFCNACGVVVKITGSAVNSFLTLFGTSASIIISSPMKLATSILSRWGRFLIPVVASGVMSTVYFHENPFASWTSHFKQNKLVAMEENTQSSLYEKF